MSEITIKINGSEIKASKNDTILSAARSAGYYIPTLCYLSKCEPIASCRLCVVEAEGSDGLVLACQTKVRDGLSLTLNSDRLEAERKKIMELYCVNHPLECGVCDKSGECELQNKTLEFGVTAQKFMAKEQKREIQDWNLIQYDPSLCVLCEKCVHVCNEIIGDDAITIRYGGYKSSIIPKNSDTLDCTFCGECVAVCPVGALVAKDFKYRSNAWELTKVPSSCAHCSSACALNYEVKHEAPESSAKAIYRVSNDYEFNTLCGAGRFEFDFCNKATRDDAAFARAVEAVKGAKAVRFSSVISNEEALILQKLKDKLGFKLINNDAKAYGEFLSAYGSTSGNSLYTADLDSIANSDFIIVFGTKIASDNPMVRYAINSASKKKNASVIYMHPIEDALMLPVVTQFVKYEPSSEHGVMALIAKLLSDEDKLIGSEKAYFESLDIGYISSECSFDEEEQAKIKKALARKSNPTIILGADLFTHPDAKAIASMAGVLERCSGFKTLIVPSKTNTLGVSLLCELDADGDYGYTVGYDAKGDFELSGTKESAQNILAMPALNQQEGTLTNINKRVVPINAALGFDGHCLNDIALSIGAQNKLTIDYTKELASHALYEQVEFDSLVCTYDKNGRDSRGYVLKASFNTPAQAQLPEIDGIGEMNGILGYFTQNVNQFGTYTKKSSKIKNEDDTILGSKAFMAASKISNNALVNVEARGKSEKRRFLLDETLKGTIALVYGFDDNGYKISKIKITSAEN